MSAAWNSDEPCHTDTSCFRLFDLQVLDLRRWLRYHVWQLVEPVPVVEVSSFQIYHSVFTCSASIRHDTCVTQLTNFTGGSC
jgi:hypothetical protein